MSHVAIYCYFRDPPAKDGLRGEDGFRHVSRWLDLRNKDDSPEIYYQKRCRQIEVIASELRPDFFIIKSIMSKGTFNLFDSRFDILCPEALEAKNPLTKRAVKLAMTGECSDVAEIVDAMNREGFLKNKVISVEAIPIRLHEYLRALCLRAKNGEARNPL